MIVVSIALTVVPLSALAPNPCAGPAVATDSACMISADVGAQRGEVFPTVDRSEIPAPNMRHVPLAALDRPTGVVDGNAVIDDPVTALAQQIEVSGGDSVLSAPLTAYQIGERFGPRPEGLGKHSGIDFVAPEGTSVQAAAGGTVSLAGSRPGFGNVVVIDHGDGYSTLYAHLSTVETTEGQSVERGEAVGTVGVSGNTTIPHLHFEVHENGVERDPAEFMEEEAGSNSSDGVAQTTLQARAEDLARAQRDIEAGMDRLAESKGGPGSEAGRRLFERKKAMHGEVADLEQEIVRLRGETRADQREASDRLDDAASTIDDDHLKERVRYSWGLIGIQDREYTMEFEAETTRIVEELVAILGRGSGTG